MITLNGTKHGTIYTHSSFLSEQTKKRIQQIHSSNQYRANWCTVLTTVAGVALYQKVPAIQKIIPAKFGLIGLGVVALASSSFASKLFSSLNQNEIRNVLNNVQYTIPVWTQPSRVINLDRIYFERDDSRNNALNIFHHGLTPEAAKAMCPDYFYGKAQQFGSTDHKAHHTH